jgi:hypothetical protein
MKPSLSWIGLFFIVCTQTVNAQSPSTNLGPQLRAAMIQGSIFLTDTHKRNWIYTVVRGEPAHLLGYEAESGKLVVDQPLPGADGAWDMAWSADGWLYVPGASGYLFRHQPGTQEVENLGLVLPGQTYVWSLTTGKNGELFGATYPGCRVFRYHPKEGFRDLGNGPLVDGENYVRSLAFHEKTDKLYAGVGSHAHLVEIDTRTGTKRELLPEKYREKEFVYGLEIVYQEKGPDYLLALLTGGQLTLVINLTTLQVERELEGIDMKTIVQEPGTGIIYYTMKSKLYQLDLSKKENSPQSITETRGSANAFRWDGKKKLSLLTSNAVYHQVSVKNKKNSTHKLEVPGQPIPIQSMMKGPDGRIWMGGYLAGGHAAFDPASGITTPYKGLEQTEGMAYSGDTIFMGIYPHGHYYFYNTKKPWDPKEGNPKHLGQVPGQSRGFAVLPLPERKKVLFGTVPDYGQLGGALVSYDLEKQQLDALVNIIPDQSIVSLVSVNDMVIMGSSISGGLGARPTAAEARLVGWNPDTKQKVFDITPLPGAIAITGLMKTSDGKIWGLADGVLFIFDPVMQQVLRTQRIHEAPSRGGHIWRSAFLVQHPNGYVYGTGGNWLFRIDPKTLEVKMLEEKASLLAMDEKGDLYFKRNTELWRYSLSESN